MAFHPNLRSFSNLDASKASGPKPTHLPKQFHHRSDYGSLEARREGKSLQFKRPVESGENHLIGRRAITQSRHRAVVRAVMEAISSWAVVGQSSNSKETRTSPDQRETLLLRALARVNIAASWAGLQKGARRCFPNSLLKNGG